MSFLKITDPAKRDFIVDDFLKTKTKIQQNFLSEKLGDIGLQNELTKLYKPITDAQKNTQQELKAIKEATSTVLQTLPHGLSEYVGLSRPISLPQYPSIEVYEDAVSTDDVKTLQLGELATQYLKQYTSNKKSVDTTFGIHSKNGIFYIGESPIEFDGDNVLIGRTVYKGTPGLWELLTMAKPNNSIYDSNDLETYADILGRTNAMCHLNNPNKPKSSRSEKYNEIIKPLWNRMLRPAAATASVQPAVGKGVRGGKAFGIGLSTIILPQDPNALVEMLTLRMASYKAGNTGVRNEIIGICDELLRQGQITREEYKKLII